MLKLALLTFLFIAHELISLPVGNPGYPSLFQEGIFNCYNIDFRLGYEGNLVFDRRMKQEITGKRVDEWEIFGNSGSLTLNLFDRVDIYTDLGAAEMEAVWLVKNGFALNRLQVKTKQDFAWNVGSNVVLLDWKNIFLGVGGRYFSTRPHIMHIKINGAVQDIASSHFFYHEWQANLGIAGKIGFLVPYIGFQYTEARSELNAPNAPGVGPEGSIINHFKSRGPAGFYLGCSIICAKMVLLNLEARLVAEEAVTFSADVRF